MREVQERKTADFVLYVLTSDMAGVYSIAEVVDDSNKRPNKTLLCILYDDKFGKKMTHSLHAVENLVKENGGRVFESLEAVARFLNIRESVENFKQW